MGAVMCAIGGSFPTVMTTLALREAKGVVSSVSVRVAVYTPDAVYVWDGFCCVDVPPSPKVHEYDSGCASGSNEPRLENVTASGTVPIVGVAFTTAVGGVFPEPT